MSLRFRVLEGANVHEFEFDRDRVTIGRGPTNDVVLEHAEISRKHGAFERRADGSVLWSTDQHAALVRSGADVAQTDGSSPSSWELRRGDVLRLGPSDAQALVIEVLSTHVEPPPTPTFTPLPTAPADLLDEALALAGQLASDDVAAALLDGFQRMLTTRGVANARVTLVLLSGPDEFKNDAWSVADDACSASGDPTAALGDAVQTIRAAWRGAPSVAAIGDLAIFGVGDPTDALLVVQHPQPPTTAVAEVAAVIRPLAKVAVARLRANRKFCALTEENRFFRDRQRQHYLVKELVRDSDAMRAVHERLRALQHDSRPVLFAGEAGTGKELFARLLHHDSERADQMLLRVNCAEVADESANIELFGTTDGLVGPSKGVLELAQGGTVLLEEIDLLPPMVQAKLCRTLKENEVRRLGDAVARPIRARVIGSIHRDVSEAITEGRLRRDLYLLFRDQTVIVPALRDRRKDILPLATKFLHSYAGRYARDVRGFTEDAQARMLQHFWPGNVRELQARVEAAVLGTSDALVDVAHLGLGS